MGDLQAQHILSSGELGLIGLADDINHLKGTTAKLLTKPTGRTVLVLDCEFGEFRARLGDFSALGSELVINGAFAADTDWTKGVGWTIAAGVANSDASQTADSDLEQTLAALTLVEGELYEVSFTVSNYVAGNITPVVAGQEGTDRTANGTFIELITAGSTQVLSLRADLDFDGDVDDFTVKVATLQSTDPVTNANGKGSFKLREDRPIAISSPNKITVVGGASDHILTYYWL